MSPADDTTPDARNDDASVLPEPSLATTEAPSFSPWLARIRMSRVVGATFGFLLVTLAGRSTGLPWDDALIRGIATGVLLFFVIWAIAVWVCGELYERQINLARESLAQDLRSREEQRRAAYLDRAKGNQSGSGGPEASAGDPASNAPAGSADDPGHRRVA